MNTKKALYLAAFSFFLLAGISANAASSDNRYFVKTTSPFWEKSFQARNIFSDGFTANLNSWQLNLAKIFGITTEPVRRLNILATTVPAKKTVTAPAAPTNPKTPTDPVAWGVKLIYGNTLTGIPTGGSDITVAVLDTGVSVKHPDLQDRILGCEDFTGVDPLTDGKCDDNNGHGTHVAGIIAADGGVKGDGIYGLAPQASILAYKVCSDDGTCFADDVAAGIHMAVDNDANIILLSEGEDTDSSLMDQALDYATAHNVLLVAAAGNGGPYKGSIDYPAANPEVISVGAVDSSINIPDWSARGTNSDSKPYLREDGDIEFAAPGVNIQSTWNNSDYSTLSGTSMAAAHVAGLAAKEWQKDADNPAAATRDILHKFSQDILPPGDDNASGWGIPRL